VRIVIIGNGVAGMEAALTVKQREPSAELTIVSEESDHFFSRTALMWVFTGQMSHRDIEPLARDVYERLGILRVRARAIGVDVASHRVQLAGGLPDIAYDRLLLACGSRPRPAPWPGASLSGVGHFVTLQDLAWFAREVYAKGLADRPPRPDAHVGMSTEDSPYWPRPVSAVQRGQLARQPAVIGGGLIGIEAVEVLQAAGHKPQFFVREEWFWPMALDARESRFITDRMRSHGIRVHLGHEIQSLEGDARDNLTGVRTDQGSFAVDACVVAIGVMPNTEWLKGSAVPRAEGGGILVEPHLLTGAPDVFAAGDCAAVRWFDGSVRPEQLWYTARDQGRLAARSLLGDSAPYARGTFYNSAKLMDIEYTTVGLVNMKLADEHEWYYEEKGKVSSSTRIVMQGERVVGFNLLGRRWDHSVLIQFIEQGKTLPWVLDHLQQASFDTEFVPQLKIPRAARESARGA
jgi:NADPH-dependent 2,4-dienoyl-CoA reductase/sulfur reductase-like enzyme